MTRGLRRSKVLGPLTVVVLAGLALVSAGAGTSASGPNVGWGGFGNTPNELRHSPLTAIDKSNVADLGRVVTVDFHAIDAGVRRGEQSFPVEANGTLYVTTNDDNVWALDATNGKVKWRWQPDNGGVYKNFGIVANRGIALCDGKIFILTLDMTIVSLNPADGSLIKRVAIASAVPGASSNYGYSETSAPICANHRLVVGAAGSEYGVRGFTMAYHTDLTPAWPHPFWTIPPEGTSWRRFARLAGGGVVWTPTTIDTATNTLYFGTGSGTPLYYPALRPGPNPRTDSLIAVDLGTGRMKWWQQQMAFNEWSYDTAQPPLVYDAKVGGKKRHIVSVGTMEGVWFAYDAKTGQPIYQRVKVIDRTEHPPLVPGKPVAVYPSSLGGLNYSPASYDASTNYIFNAASETASVEAQVKLSPTQKKRKRLLGDIFLGLENGNFGALLPGWHDHGSISAIDVNTGKQVWKFQTPEPERGGVTTTDSGLGFAGGGDGNLRAFDLKSGKVLWSFQTGHQIAAGPSIYSVDGKEYIAITSGGTPTSSNGGIASELQIFALGGSSSESKPPTLSVSAASSRSLLAAGQRKTVATPKATARTRHASASGAGRLKTQSGLVVQAWDANSNNDRAAVGRVLFGSKPVAGARVSVDGYTIPAATAKNGTFTYPVDITVTGRHVATVTSAARATIAGRPLSESQQGAVQGLQAGFSVGYAIDDLKAKTQPNGTVLVTGRARTTGGGAPPPVVLYTYRLNGTVTDSAGKPVQGAIVVTRTADRDFWTFSSPTDAQGHYSSFFSAADEQGSNPVPLAVQVAVGPLSYGGAQGTNFNFKRLSSATLDVQLGKTTAAALSPATPTSYAGAVYEGLIVGVNIGGRVIKPVSERWPDTKGNFSMVLPASTRGKTLHFWENRRQFFSRFPATSGGPVDLVSWPTALGSSVPADLATLAVPR
jgi:PQQ-dependent dehydrogenase (methanol/ethanol family)